MDRILDMASKVSKYCEVRYMESSSIKSAMRNSEFMGEERSSEEGIAIRMLNNSISMGYISSNESDKVKTIIDQLEKRSKLPGRNKLDDSGGVIDKWEATGKRKVDDFDESERLDLLKTNDSTMKEHEVSVRLNVFFHRKTDGIFMNSTGSQIDSDFSRIGYFMIGGYKNGENFEQIYRQFGTTGGIDAFESLKVNQNIEDSTKNLSKISASKATKPGIYDVVIGPEIAGIVAHESCGHPTEWDRIIGREGSLAGESFLTGKPLPFKIGSEVVSVIDDPTIRGSYGFYKYDDEGIKSRKRYLYKNGMTSEFIQSRESASRMGVAPNGGGRTSSWDREPLARMSTTYIEPGEFQFGELVEGIKDGIFIKTYTEWNIDDIRFNEKYVGSEAYLIKNGKLGELVKRPAIEINTVKFYSSVDAISNELEFSAGTCGKGDPEQGVDTWMGGPSVRLRKIRIT